MPEIGQTISHYWITAKLGMGEVYRVGDTNLDRQVAIKVLPDIFSGDPERLARFEREAKMLASLNHAKIATIHGLEEAGGKGLLCAGLMRRQWDNKGNILWRKMKHLKGWMSSSMM